MNLSERQRKILAFIIEFTQKHDYPPTIREIGKKVGISSTSVVNYNLAKLEEMELLTRERDVSRGLSLNRPRLAEGGYASAENGDYNGAPVAVGCDASPAAAAVLHSMTSGRTIHTAHLNRFRLLFRQCER